MIIKLRGIIVLSILFVLALFLAGCSGISTGASRTSSPVSALVITTTTLPAGTIGTTYSQQVTATGGTGPYTWSVTSGSLPSGLSLNPSTAVISGAPTSANTFLFTITTVDSKSASKSAALSITVTAPAALAITTTTLPSGTVGTSYSQQVTATGGTPPYTWSVTSGSLPNGLSLNPSTAVISGIPTSANTFPFTITAVDSRSASRSAALSISVTQVVTTVLQVQPNPPTQNMVAGATLNLLTLCYTASSRDDCSTSLSGINTTYSSSNTTVATVAGNVVTAVALGTATITANHNGVTGTMVVTIVTAPTGSYFVGTTGVGGQGDAKVAYSTQSEPAKGTTYTDPTYYLTVKRVTDSTNDTPIGQQIYATQTEYPSWDPSSSDGAYLIFTGCISQLDYQNGTGCNQYLLYNGTTDAYMANLTCGSGIISGESCAANGPLQGGLDAEAPEPRWNRGTSQAAHAFTYRRYMELREYNVDTQTDSLVHNFMNEFGPTGTIAHIATAGSDTSNTGYLVFCNEYCSPSDNTRYYGLLFGKPNSDTYYYALVYDRVLDSVVGYHDISGSNSTGGLKGLLLSPSGQYVVVNYFCNGSFATNEFCGVTVYNQAFTQYYRVSGYPDHMGWAYDKQGHEVIVISSSETDVISFVRVDTGQIYELYDQHTSAYPFILYTYQSHPGWSFIGTMSTWSGSSWSGSAWSAEGPYGPGQLFALELDETKCSSWFDTFAPTPLNPSPTSTAYGGVNAHSCTAPSAFRIWRQAFNQNAIGSPTISYYFQQVNPQSNIAGTKIWFGANWRNAANRSEVYEVDLPATWPTDLN